MRAIRTKIAVLFMVCILLQSFVYAGFAVAYKYDDLGRLIQVTYDDGQIVTYNYDSAGNITEVKVLKQSNNTMSIYFKEELTTLEEQQTVKLTPYLKNEKGEEKAITQIGSWSSENQEVASVDAQGNVKAIKEGHTAITFYYDGCIASNKVVVNPYVDRIKPSAPTGIKLSQASAHFLKFQWLQSKDNIGISHYLVLREGVKIGETEELKWTDENLEPNKLYKYTLVAVDPSMNESPVSTTLNVKTLPDKLPPNLPEALKLTEVIETKAMLNWNTSTDDTAMGGYEVYLNSKLVGKTIVPSYQFTGLKPNTNYACGVLAYDKFNNKSVQTKLVFKTPADVTPPNRVENIKWTLKKTWLINRNEVTLSWNSGVDNVAISGYEIFINGKSYAKTNKTRYVIKGLKNKTKTEVVIRAYDSSANKAPVSETVIIDIP